MLLTTHYMDEAQALADRVIVIAAGRIVAEGPPESIGGRADADAQIRFLLPQGITVDQLPIPARARRRRSGRHHDVDPDGDAAAR